MEDPNHCDKCGENTVIMDGITGMMVCDSCGFVKEDTDFRSPWEFINGECVGNFVSANDTGARAASRYASRANGRWTHSRGVYSYRERKKALAMKKLDQITSLLRLSIQRVNEVKFMVEKITKGDWGAGRWLDILIGACIYVVVRQNHLPLTITEVAVVVDCDVSELGRMYNRVLNFLDIKLPDPDLFIFLERAVTTFPAFSGVDLEKKRQMLKHGRLLLQGAFQWFLTTGRRPLPIVASILALVAEVNEVNVGLECLSRELHVPTHTSKLRYKELQDSLVRVGQSLPWRKDITTKTVIRHAPFILHYMEIKSKSKPKDKETNVRGISKPIENAKAASGKAAVISLEGKAVAIRSFRPSKYSFVKERPRLTEEQTHSKSLVDSTGGSQMTEKQLSRSRMNMEGTGGPELNEMQESHHESNANDASELKISAKSLAEAYEQFSRDFASIKVKMLQTEENKCKKQHGTTIQMQNCDRTIHATYLDACALGHERISLQEIVDKQMESDSLPPSFVASVEARARRREKIIAAKVRISEVKEPMNKHLWIQDRSAQNNAEQLKDSLRLSGSLSSLSKKRKRQLEKGGIDWEDCIIECLLLHEADEKEIEDGHYNAMLDLHVFKSNENISDDELQQYFRTKEEVWCTSFGIRSESPMLFLPIVLSFPALNYVSVSGGSIFFCL